MDPNYQNTGHQPQNGNMMPMYGGAKSFSGQDFMDDFDQPPEPAGPSLFSENDAAVMNMFWQNPDQPLPLSLFGYQITSDQAGSNMDPSSSADSSSRQMHAHNNHMQGNNRLSHDNTSQGHNVLNAESFLDNNDINAASTLNNFRHSQSSSHSFATTDPIPDQASWGSMPVALNPASFASPVYTSDTRQGPNGTREVVLTANGQTWGEIIRQQQPQVHRESLLDFFGVPQQQQGRPPPPPPAFGSDANFTGGRYQPSHSHDHDAKGGNLLHVPMAEHASAPNGQQYMPRQGPVANGQYILPQHTGQWAMPTNQPSQSLTLQHRRKSIEQCQDEAEWRPSNGVKREFGSDEEATSPHKRQKSYPYPPQQMMVGTSLEVDLSRKKENLTDIQKRKNHILSEKKRRQIINQGYHDLNNLVPCLANGKSGLSRSECLNEIYAYLATLGTGTAEMLRQLELPPDALKDVKPSAES